MTTRTPRLRVFAGPNGSGKSTLKSVLPGALLGFYLNPDEIEQEMRRHGFLDLGAYGVTTTCREMKQFFNDSDFLKSSRAALSASQIDLADGRLVFDRERVNSYFASVTSDFMRQKLLKRKASFTFETVMSHPGKVELLRQAQLNGYRTYLYYIATDDPDINISRVRNRVKLGGHPVPEDKIISRYHRSLELLMSAIRCTNRAYIFDNSGHQMDRAWLAEVTDGSVIELKTDQIPAWFRRAVLDKLGG